MSLRQSLSVRESLAQSGADARCAEIELLLLGSRPHPDQYAWTRISALATGGLDWGYVTRQAVHHGTAALLYSNLCKAGVPAHAVELAQLKRIATDAANRSLYLFGELLRITAALEHAGIPAMPLKGPILAVTAYGDVSLRDFSDIDILVGEQDLHRARDVLLRLNFRCRHHKNWVEPYLLFGHELDFISPDNAVQVDLQWRFAKKWLSLPVDPIGVWSDVRSTTVAGQILRQPSPEANLLVLCGHGYRHAWSRLKWIMDISAFVHRYGDELDTTRLIAHARARGGLRLLSVAVWLAREVGGSAMGTLLERCCNEDGTVERLGRSIKNGLFAESSTGPRGSGGFLHTIVFHWLARERLKEKLPSARPLLTHAAYILRRQVRHHFDQLSRPSHQTDVSARPTTQLPPEG